MPEMVSFKLCWFPNSLSIFSPVNIYALSALEQKMPIELQEHHEYFLPATAQTQAQAEGDDLPWG